MYMRVFEKNNMDKFSSIELRKINDYLSNHYISNVKKNELFSDDGAKISILIGVLKPSTCYGLIYDALKESQECLYCVFCEYHTRKFDVEELWELQQQIFKDYILKYATRLNCEYIKNIKMSINKISNRILKNLKSIFEDKITIDTYNNFLNELSRNESSILKFIKM